MSNTYILEEQCRWDIEAIRQDLDVSFRERPIAAQNAASQGAVSQETPQVGSRHVMPIQKVF